MSEDTTSPNTEVIPSFIVTPTSLSQGWSREAVREADDRIASFNSLTHLTPPRKGDRSVPHLTREYQTPEMITADRATLTIPREEGSRQDNFKQLCTERLDKLETKYKALEQKHLQTERKLRKNNVLIFGLPIPKKDLVDKTLTELNDLLNINLTEADLNNCYLIGKDKAKPGIVLEFLSYFKKQLIFNNIKNLKGKNIYIVNDLCPEDQREQKILRKHLNAAKLRKQQARIKGHSLEIDGKIYTVEQLEGRESEIEEDVEEGGEEEEEGNSRGEITRNRIKNKKIVRNKNKKY